MLKKYTGLGRSVAAAILFALIGILGACDPCRQLAEQRCNLNTDENLRKQCIKDLSLAESQQYPKRKGSERDQEVCVDLLKKCFASDVLMDNDLECGDYRRN